MPTIWGCLVLLAAKLNQRPSYGVQGRINLICLSSLFHTLSLSQVVKYSDEPAGMRVIRRRRTIGNKAAYEISRHGDGWYRAGRKELMIREVSIQFCDIRLWERDCVFKRKDFLTFIYKINKPSLPFISSIRIYSSLLSLLWEPISDVERFLQSRILRLRWSPYNYHDLESVPINI